MNLLTSGSLILAVTTMFRDLQFSKGRKLSKGARLTLKGGQRISQIRMLKT